jgi:hypothetical protein
MGQDEFEDQWRGKAILVLTRRRSKEQGERFDTSLFIPQKKTEAIVQNPRPR